MAPMKASEIYSKNLYRYCSREKAKDGSITITLDENCLLIEVAKIGKSLVFKIDPTGKTLQDDER
jgi:hypothetical protein